MAVHRPFSVASSPHTVPSDWGRKWQDATLFLADDELKEALELARSLEHPLLLTGDPGCGKTTAAYWAALQLGLKPAQLIHAQIRSDSTAAQVKYHFDAISFFRESTLAANNRDVAVPNRREFIYPGELWQAFTAAERGPAILLFDEIDKAPRDFPNDLLHEIELRKFEVRELPLPGGGFEEVKAPPISDTKGLHLVVMTSNGERKLPRAFLRRCVHHHLPLREEWLRTVVHHHVSQRRITLEGELLELALEQFLALRTIEGLYHAPGIGECLVWLEMLSVRLPKVEERLRTRDLRQLPHLGALIKEADDLKRVHSR